MAHYHINVAFERDHIVLQARGHLDTRAGRHLLELARVAAQRLARPVHIDLAGVGSSTPGGAHLVTARELQRLPGMISLRTPLPKRPPRVSTPIN